MVDGPPAVDRAPGPRTAPWRGPWDPFRRLARRIRHPTALDAAFLAILLVTLVTVELAYRENVLPPGEDSGHWLAVSYSFIGHFHPPDWDNQPLLYPPGAFPLIGLAYLVTGNPIGAVQLAGGLLLVLYGLSCIHLARRYLTTRPGQLLFVGAAILNGTTLQVLFWGGFPNFLAFAILNEAMIFLLLFLRSEGLWEGLGLGAFVGALYLTHNLSFVVAAVGIALMGLLWLIDGRGSGLRILRRPGLIGGATLVVGSVVGYALASRLLGVSHPGYLFANPASYVIDPIGIIFRPFQYAPAFLPTAPGMLFPSYVVVGMLFAIFGALFVAALVAVFVYPGRVPFRALIVAAWLGAAVVIPAAGYAARIDTDYPRFAYFFPLPFALGAVLLTELEGPGLLARWRASRAGARVRAWPLPAFARGTGGRSVAPLVAVGLVLVLLYATVSVPSVQTAEGNYLGVTHDANYVSAVEWIHHQTGPGTIVTETPVNRWTETLTGRVVYSTGPTWLHFFKQQILDDELAYWSLSAHYVATDTEGALAFSGYNSSGLDSFPVYTGYLEGVPFPTVRLAESTLAVTYLDPHRGLVNDSYNASTWGLPTFTLSPVAPVITASFVEPAFRLNVTASMNGSGGGNVAILALPTPGVRLVSVSFQLAPPQIYHLGGSVPFLTLAYAGGGARNFSWSVRGPEGALPGKATATVNGTFSQAPDANRSFATPAVTPMHLTFTFDAAPSGLSVLMHLAGPSWSNPAITLPPTLDAMSFLNSHGVRFLLVQNTTGYLPAASLYSAEYGFSLVYENPEWLVLER